MGVPALTASSMGRESPSSNEGTTITLADASSAAMSESLSRPSAFASPGRIAAVIDRW